MAESAAETTRRDPNQIMWKDRKHWMWFPWTFTVYSIKNERLYLKKGFFKTIYDETLLYRIVDVRLTRNLWQKLFGTGTISLFTRVDVGGEIRLENVKHSVQVKEYISDMVEDIRRSKNVVGKEFYGAMSGHHMMIDTDGDGIADDMADAPDSLDDIQTFH